MAPAKAAARALAQAFYEESRLPAWPDWDGLRERTKDLMAAFVVAVAKDRDKPLATRFQCGSPTRTPDPLPVPVNRYAAGSEPAVEGVLLQEAGFAPG